MGTKWVTASLKFKPNQLTNQELVDNLLTTIGCRIFLPRKCGICNKTLSAESNDHFSGTCAKSAHSGANRKTSEKAVWEAFQLLGISTLEKEPLCEIQEGWRVNNPSTVKKRGDILIHLGAKTIIVDVVVSNNFSKIPIKNRETPFALCNQNEKDKKNDYQKHFSFPPNSFCPFAIDLHGGLGDDTSNLINEIHDYFKTAGNVDPNSLHYALCKISIATCKMVTRCAEICRKGNHTTN
jgi:hypothetical protein